MIGCHRHAGSARPPLGGGDRLVQLGYQPDQIDAGFDWIGYHYPGTARPDHRRRQPAPTTRRPPTTPTSRPSAAAPSCPPVTVRPPPNFHLVGTVVRRHRLFGLTLDDVLPLRRPHRGATQARVSPPARDDRGAHDRRAPARRRRTTSTTAPSARRPHELAHKASAGLRWGAFNQGTQQVIRLGVQVVLTRLLSPDDFGAMALALVVINIGTLIGALGFAQVLVQRHHITRRHVAVAFTTSGAIGFAFMILVICRAPAASPTGSTRPTSDRCSGC